MIKTGIMGGTFNPIHNGHLIIALYAKEQFDLDEIWFMVSGNPPHKQKSNVCDAQIRYKMTNLAIEDNKDFIPCDYEIRKKGRSYTVDTLKYLNKAYTDRKFYFIVGQDSLHDFPKWYKPEEILSLATVLVFPRNSASLEDEAERIRRLYGGDIQIISAPLIGFSSTQIRQRVSEGKSIRYMVPDIVCEYIKKNNLYID